MSRSIRRALAAGIPIAVAACAASQSGGGTTGGGSYGGSGGGAGAGMSFFVTSVGTGRGAYLGGLEGADRHCQSLATAAGASGKTWRAYLSTQGKDGTPTVNARDRIGRGPWHNAKGVLIARDVEHLHSANNNIGKRTALNEKGQPVEGRGDTPNRHDILTGSRADGTAFSPHVDMTCGNWTNSGPDGVAMVGHHDKLGPTSDPWSTSWNSSHPTRGGCSTQALRGTGGEGLLYCFAAD